MSVGEDVEFSCRDMPLRRLWALLPPVLLFGATEPVSPRIPNQCQGTSTGFAEGRAGNAPTLSMQRWPRTRRARAHSPRIPIVPAMAHLHELVLYTFVSPQGRWASGRLTRLPQVESTGHPRGPPPAHAGRHRSTGV